MAVVLVTGGSSGIGLATVTRLAAAGHRVFTASRNPTRNELPEGVTPMVLNVADPAAAEPAIAEVVDAAGRLDALVNNAGIVTLAAMEEMSDDEAHHLVEVNLFGPLRLARAAINPMREAGGGRIVNVTSMNDVMPAPFVGWYSASKAALWSASRALDAEVHRFGVRVSVVAPGLFRSEMTEAAQQALEVPVGSMYEAELRGTYAMNLSRVQSAGDPDLVARGGRTVHHRRRPTGARRSRRRRRRDGTVHARHLRRRLRGLHALVRRRTARVTFEPRRDHHRSITQS